MRESTLDIRLKKQILTSKVGPRYGRVYNILSPFIIIFLQNLIFLVKQLLHYKLLPIPLGLKQMLPWGFVSFPVSI